MAGTITMRLTGAWCHYLRLKMRVKESSPCEVICISWSVAGSTRRRVTNTSSSSASDTAVVTSHLRRASCSGVATTTTVHTTLHAQIPLWDVCAGEG